MPALWGCDHVTCLPRLPRRRTPALDSSQGSSAVGLLVQAVQHRPCRRQGCQGSSPRSISSSGQLTWSRRRDFPV
jgi:hypothetical protein